MRGHLPQVHDRPCSRGLLRLALTLGGVGLVAALPSTAATAACNSAAVAQLRSYVASKPAGSGVVLRGGVSCATWGNPDQLYDIKSATKSVGSLLLGVAMLDRKVGLDDRVGSDVAAILDVPAVKAAWPGQVTYRQLGTQTAGFTKGGYTGKITFQPGTKWAYSDGGANWIADGLTSVYRQDLKELAIQRVLAPIGVPRSALSWRSNVYRSPTLAGAPRREFGAGVRTSTRAMAQIGRLLLDGGRWNGRQLIDADFVAALGRPQAGTVGRPAVDAAYAKTGAPKHYGILWWTNGDGAIAGLPRDAFWAWGLGEALILVVPSLDIVASRAGSAWQKGWLPSYGVVGPFFQKVAAVAR